MINVPYEEQIRIKYEELKKYLNQFDAKIFDFVVSKQYHYRNKMEFAFKKVPDKVYLGLHYRGKYWKIEDIKECLLINPYVNNILEEVRSIVKEKNIDVYNSRKHTGNFRYLVVKESKRKEVFMLNFVTFKEEFPFKDEIISRITKKFDRVKSIYWSINSKISDTAIGEKVFHLYGERLLLEVIGDKKYLFSPYSFIQPNIYVTEKMYFLIKNISDLNKDDVILDLYSGSGGISIFLSEKCKYFYGIESDPNSYELAFKNMEINSVKNGNFIKGEVEKVLPVLKRKKFSLVVLDPPRSGMSKKALRRLFEKDFNKAIFVSCNIKSSIDILKEFSYNDFKIKGVYPFDMFPNTKHFEVVFLLER